MSMLPEERYRSSFKRSLEKLKQQVSLIDYAATIMELEKFGGGGWWIGCCPISSHEDRTPSFFVYPAGSDGAAHAHCYGCGFHGDIFDLFQAAEGGELWTAMVALAERFGVELPKRSPRWFERNRRQHDAREAIERAKIAAAQRRLFKLFEPSLARLDDPEEREAEAEAIYADMKLPAKLLVSKMRGAV